MKIEFFHDPLCVYCFPMSAILRRLQKKYPQIEIIHRSFALSWEASSFIQAFGPREGAREKILPHWDIANGLDPDHRINRRGMEEEDFLYPLSKKPLIGAKAAGELGGQDLYWDAFDAIQRKLFMENKNIEEFEVLKEAMGEIGLDLGEWTRVYQDPKTEREIIMDLVLAKKLGVEEVPSLLIGGEILITGGMTQDQVEEKIKAYME